MITKVNGMMKRAAVAVYGLRFTVYGLRFTVYGLRFTVYGLLFTVYGLQFTVCSAAQGINEAEVRQKINQAASALKTMQCDFVQTKHLKLMNNDMVAKGKMYYQQSDKLRWEYITPYSYTFILNGDRVLLKNRNRNDVIDVNRNKLFREIARIMMNSVTGGCLADDKDFKTTLSASGSEWTATMTPLRKDMRQMFQKITLHLDKQKWTVTRVELTEKNGDRTSIELKNIVKNETIETKMFAVH